MGSSTSLTAASTPAPSEHSERMRALADLLPRVASLEQYSRVYADSRVWAPAVNEIAVRHGLPMPGTRQTLGSHIVYRFGDSIVKLYFPMWFEDYRVEGIALSHIKGLPTPHITAEGEIEGWPYLVITARRGLPAVEVWSRLNHAARLDVVTQVGEILRTLHQHSLPTELTDDWAEFIGTRLARAEQHHNAPEPWRGWIQQQLEGFREPDLDHVLLNCDLTEDHVLLSEEDGCWRVTGLIDFGDVRIGHPYYDFVAPLCHYTYGDPRLSTRLLRAYGLRSTSDVTASLTRYCLLHEFGRLRDFLDRHPAANPWGFVEALWGVEQSAQY